MQFTWPKTKKKKKNLDEIIKRKPIPILFSLSVSLSRLSLRLWFGASPPPLRSDLLLMITVNDHSGWSVELHWCLPIGWWSRWSSVDCREEGEREESEWETEKDIERWETVWWERERGIDKVNKILVFYFYFYFLFFRFELQWNSKGRIVL